MISIIMPFYNRENIIEKAINSVLIQTYTNWELILVNDGSTDLSEVVIKQFHDSRIRYIKLEKNEGACHARNVGLKNASGEIIGFLDSDNVWDKNFLKIRMKSLKNKNLDFVFGFYCFVDQAGKEMIWPALSSTDMNDRQFMLRYMCKENPIDTNTVLMTRQCVDQIGFFDEKLKRFQDWDYFGRLFWKRDLRYCHQDNLLVKGYSQDNSISNCVSYWDARIKLLYKNLEKIRSVNMLGEVMQHIYERTFLIPVTEEQKERIFYIMTADDYFQFLDQQKQRNESAFYLSKMKHWVFEEEIFKQNAVILIYGYGDVGKDFVYQIQHSKRLRLAGVVDRKYSESKNNSINFFDVSEIKNIQYDYILVAIYEKNAAESIVENLVKLGTAEEKIVWVDLMNQTGRRGEYGEGN